MGNLLQRFATATRSSLKDRPILSNILVSVREQRYKQALQGMGSVLQGKRYVLSSSTLGLSNRIKCLLSSMRLAAAASRMLLLYWPRNWACRCNFADLFENPILEIDSHALSILQERARRNSGHLVVDTWKLLCLKGDLPPDFQRTYDGRRTTSIDFEYGSVPIGIRNAYLLHVHTLKPIAYIRSEVEKFARRFASDTVSVSIRSWPECDDRAQALFSLDRVFQTMDKFSNRTMFVSCDSQELLEALARRYGRRVLHYPKRTGTNDRVSPSGMQDIFIDLLLLAQNRHLVASYLSTYPEMAWWFGGCSATVEIIEERSAIAAWIQNHDGDETNIIPSSALEENVDI